MEIEKRKPRMSLLPELSIICVALVTMLFVVWNYEPRCCASTNFWSGIYGGLGLLLLNMVSLKLFGWISRNELFAILAVTYISMALFAPHSFFATYFLSLPGNVLLYSSRMVALGIIAIGTLIALTTLIYHLMYPDEQIGNKRRFRAFSVFITLTAMSYMFAIGWQNFPD